MEKTQTYSLTGSTTFVLLPNDFIEITDLYYDTTNLARVPLARLIEMSDPGTAGTPQYFSREGEKLKIYPYPSGGSITMNYYGQFPDLVADTDSNDLSVLASDLITYGALSYASDYFLDERGQLFEGKFVQFLTELQEQANDAEVSGTVQAMQPMATYSE